MHYNSKDISLCIFVTIFVVCFDVYAIYFIKPVIDLFPQIFHGVIILFLFFLFFWILIGPIYTRILISFIKFKNKKLHLKNNSRTFSIWKQLMYSYGLTLNPFTKILPNMILPLFYRLFGAKIGKSVLIGGELGDPYFVEIGDKSVLGHDSVITAHLILEDKIVLERIKIGKNVVIGIQAIIMPGVEIGDKSIVLPNSVVNPNTKIPPNEEWGGTPAKKIKNIKLKELI